MQMLAGSTEKEASLLIKYGKDGMLLSFRDIANSLLNTNGPLPESLVLFRGAIGSLNAAQTAADVRKIFLGNDHALHASSLIDFFTDLADANEREGDILMRCATDKHLYALRDTAMELLVGRIHLTVNQADALDPFWSEIRELALPVTVKEISKTLFHHFQGRLQLLQGIVIPVLSAV